MLTLTCNLGLTRRGGGSSAVLGLMPGPRSGATGPASHATGSGLVFIERPSIGMREPRESDGRRVVASGVGALPRGARGQPVHRGVRQGSTPTPPFQSASAAKTRRGVCILSDSDQLASSAALAPLSLGGFVREASKEKGCGHVGGRGVVVTVPACPAARAVLARTGARSGALTARAGAADAAGAGAAVVIPRGVPGGPRRWHRNVPAMRCGWVGFRRGRGEDGTADDGGGVQRVPTGGGSRAGVEAVNGAAASKSFSSLWICGQAREAAAAASPPA